jgi:sporulation protein YqfC
MSKASVSEWLKSRISDASAPLRAGRIEIVGDFEVSVHGCRRIIHYSPEKISLQMKKKGGIVTFEGEGLLCTSFFVGSVVIEGKIEKVELSGFVRGK